VRKDGGISQPKENVVGENGRRRPVERLTTIPHLVQVEFAAASVLIAGLLLFAIFVPTPLEELANPGHPPNPAKAAWYFMGLQELLLHMHPLSAMLLAGLVLLGLVFLPRLDRDAADIGHYFRSAVGRRAAALAALLSLGLIPMLVVVDEWYLDLPALLSGWPTLLSNGLLPLLFSLFGLFLIYALFRWGGRLRHSEALVGLFSFIFVSLIILTFIGVFFRGANMALVWPF